MIVATAGHIDHGKTLLVKALTGVDADRLPEEKRRGMTIDLGFAYLPTASGGVIGFVDVPGHERFLRNMLAGVTGVDAALLVVAADDGPMPQTHEHLAILDLLGIATGAVALTKIDRVEAPRRAAAEEEVRAALKGTLLAAAPLFPVSALTGEGLPAVRGWLEAAAVGIPARDAEGGFRLAIDRAFVLPGPGLVVTGTVASGRVAAGDRLVLSPPGLGARVRGLRAQDRVVREARAGDRAALNIVGPEISRAMVTRGQWLVAPDLHAPTARLDVRLRLLSGLDRGLRSGARVHLHVGAAGTVARAIPLGMRDLAPGEAGFVQLLTAAPIGALAGDRLVLRDEEARTTIGGGVVVDPWPPARGRSRPERLAWLGADALPELGGALGALVALAPGGVALAPFARRRNLPMARVAALARDVGAVCVGEGAFGFAAALWEQVLATVLAALRRAANAAPARGAFGLEELGRALGRRLATEVLASAVAALVADGRVERTPSGLRLPGQRAQMAAADQALWQRIEPLLGEARPPATASLADRLGLEIRVVDALLRRLMATGALVRISDRRYIARTRLASLARLAEDLTGADGWLQVGAFRDGSELGRNLAIEVLEYFDRVGFTRRETAGRRLLKRAGDALPQQRVAG
ncbi:MAG: selenocysteine-specific translation elongation factor [Alphaproteobacteria bacterium]|nr:selenocysteine-specific translation elongation factor [Alphaproteobacteria bacterium]